MPSASAKLLAIDTSTEQCSVAVLRDGSLSARESQESKSHARVLLPMVDKLLRSANMELLDLDAILVGLGPGSFTGVRIGVSIAQGLAYGVECPLLGTSSLEVLAKLLTVPPIDAGQCLIPCLDARMSEVYWAVYQQQTDGFRELVSPRVTSPEVFNDYIDTIGPFIGAGHGWALSEVRAKNYGDKGRIYTGRLPHAEGLMMLWGEKFEPLYQTRNCPSQIEPLYLRNEVAWAKRVRIRGPS